MTIKAILINPFERTVEEVEYNGDYKHIYTLIDAHSFDVARIDRNDAIFVDDEGLFAAESEDCPQEFFVYLDDDGPRFLAGKGLILGCDSEGESISPVVTLDEARYRVRFFRPEHKGVAINQARAMLAMSGTVISFD